MKQKVKWKANVEFSEYTEDEIFEWFRKGKWLDGTPVKITLEFEEPSKEV